MQKDDYKRVIEVILKQTHRRVHSTAFIPFLSTTYLMKELLDSFEHIDKRRLNKSIIPPIEKELIEKIGTDPVFIKLSEVNNLSKPMRKNVSEWVKENYDVVEKNYLDVAFDMLEEKIIAFDLDLAFEKVIECTISRLTDVGFSTLYIHEFVENLKNVQDKTPENVFSKFKERFSKGPTKSIVVFKSKIKGPKHVWQELDEYPDVKGESDREREFYEAGFQYTCVEDIDYDRFSSAESALENAKLYFDAKEICNKGLEIKEKCLVYNAPKTKPMAVPIHKKIMNFDSVDSELQKIFCEHPTEILNLLDEESGESFKNSISAFDSALKSNSAEIQFMLLWTALETLVKTPEGKKTIDVVIESLSCIIESDIKRKVAKNIFDSDKTLRNEIPFTIRRLYIIRNLLIHKYDVHDKLEQYLPVLFHCYTSSIYGVAAFLLEDNSAEKKTSLREIYERKKAERHRHPKTNNK